MNIIFPHQKNACDELLRTAHVFFECRWHGLPIRPRFARIVCGPTGSGKSHIVRHLARELGLPLFEIAVSTWIPLGATQRGAKITWPDLARFISNNERGILFLDELDKLSSARIGSKDSSAWSESVVVECFSALDRILPTNLQDDLVENDGPPADELPDLARRLFEGYFVVGAGAWQRRWTDSRKNHIGFRGAKERAAFWSKSILGADVPVELVNRFAGPVICLPDLVADDYRAMIRHLLPSLPEELRSAVATAAERDIGEAVSSGLGCRWPEELLLRCLSESTISNEFAPPAVSPDPNTLSERIASPEPT